MKSELRSGIFNFLLFTINLPCSSSKALVEVDDSLRTGKTAIKQSHARAKEILLGGEDLKISRVVVRCAVCKESLGNVNSLRQSVNLVA